jgi:hypothetical protein
MFLPGQRPTPHTSFDTLAEAKRFLISLEEEDVYIKDRLNGNTYWYRDGKVVEETEV